MRATNGGLARIGLVGLSLLLVHCAEQVDDTATSTNPIQPAESATAAPDGSDKRIDTRGALAAVESGGDRAQRSDDLAADARAYAARIAARAGVREPEFVDFRTSTGVDGLTHVRLNQIYRGLPVWGADVVVHATATEIIGMTGSISTNLDGLDVTITLGQEEALTRAKAEQFGSRPPSTERDAVEPIVFVDAAGTAHVAHHSSFYNELDEDFAPGLWHYVHDAKSGEVLARWNGLHTLSQASGPGGNAKHAHSWSGELDVTAQSGGYVMTTSKLATTDMKHAKSGSGSAVTSTSLTFSDPAMNDAHGYAEVTLATLASLGHNSIDDKGFVIRSRVHYGTNYENAFWNGQTMTYGDGASYFYALSGALDVVGHEIHHGFTHKHSRLAYSGEAGGLNEAFSDIAGKTVEWSYKAQGEASFNLGGDIFRKSSGAMRYMCSPASDGRSIDHASKMTPSLNPHYASGVPNKVFCRLAKRLSSGSPTGTASKAGVKRAAAPFYLANADYWTSSTTFVQGCKGTVDAARALGYGATEVDAIKTSWGDVGVYCDGAATAPPSCDVKLTGTTGTVTSPSYPNNYPDRFKKTWCIDAAQGRKVKLTFTDFATEAGYDFVTIADDKGAVLSKTSGTTKPAAATAARVYLTFTTDGRTTDKGWSASWTTQ